MSIKQQGGVFGRNPTFNNVGVDGDLNVDAGTFFVEADTGKVGVKNNAPSNNFTVGPNTAFPWSSAYASFRGPIYVYDPASSSFGLRIGHSSNVPYLQGYRETVGVTRLDLQPLGGDVQITNGNVIVANGKGIDFSATSGTGTSELFDDYEEGVHTATVTCGTSGTIGLQSNTSLAYTKVGDIVHVQGYLYVGSVSSPTGSIRVSVPFAAADLTGGGGSAAASVWMTNVNTANVANFVARIAEGNSYIEIELGDAVAAQADSAQEVKTGTQIWVSATYKAA